MDLDWIIKALAIWCLAGLAIVISIWAFAAILKFVGATLIAFAEWRENDRGDE